MKELIGLRIIAVKGSNKEYNSGKRKKHIEPEFIFFDDGMTYIQLDEQDYYTYHDCSSSARHIRIIKDKEGYKNLINSEHYSDSNTDL